MAETEYILEATNIVKEFPGVHALKGVDLKVKKGEILGLVGENGAGKSTLMKCIIGIHPPSSGEIVFDGVQMKKYSTIDALNMGISMIQQELSPIEHRPIMENIWIGREPKTKLGLVDHQKMYKMTKDLLASVGMDEDPKMLVKDLTVAKQQMVEIAKAISYQAKLIIMDEPTSAISGNEIAELFSLMRKVKEEGRSIIYISHKLDEIYNITDRVVILRDGEFIASSDINKIQVTKMIEMMVGREIKDFFPKIKCDIGEVKMRVEGLSSGKKFQNISFDVRKGEILGVAGLIGAGRTELIETIFGIRKKTAGKVFIDGKKVDIKSPADAIENGMAFLTEDRRLNGIFPVLSVKINLVVANLNHLVNKSGFLSNKLIVKKCLEYIKAIQIKTPSQEQIVMNLSGGNQQKVLVGRWLMTNPEILFLDEPTRGIDVGTKAEIHKLISELAGQCKSIVMVSSELPEILGMSDRIIVLNEGRLTGVLENTKKLTQEEVMKYATKRER
ncbi:MAG: sugar ABC transporter ATP-binding protein [Chloroflexi bacterium]|nr:sugar ABC transporter ATP-binding protein [Chloroflexota bacterium]